MRAFLSVLTLVALLGVGCSAGQNVTLGSRALGSAGAGPTHGSAGAATLSLGGATGNLYVDGGSVVAPTMCTGSTTTTVSGTVYDPAGNLPLDNVIVYIPSQPLAAFTEGVTCDKCAGTASGAPVAAALSDADGRFVLKDAPPGANIPLVIQIGKWRRQVTIPTVTACVDNPITDPNLTRLPRNQSEGHIPQIAITTGHADALECLLRKIGIDDKEFTTDAGSGRVHMFVGCNGSGLPANQFAPALGGSMFPDATTLWAGSAALMKCDILVLSCEGSQCATAKTPYCKYQGVTPMPAGGCSWTIFTSIGCATEFSRGPRLPTTSERAPICRRHSRSMSTRPSRREARMRTGS